MDSYCSDCPDSMCGNSSGLTDPNSAYNNAWYHYQSYLYYWNRHNAQISHISRTSDGSSCECDDDRQENNSFGYDYPMHSPHSRCPDCPDVTYSSTEYTNINESKVCHKETDRFEEENDDEDDFEVDESFREFLIQSAKHREEREKKKRADAKNDEYVEVGKIQIKASTLPPQEQQGTKRKEAMKLLYGDNAPFIMSLEASLQLHYDRNFDTRQPKFWPSIPLKF